MAIDFSLQFPCEVRKHFPEGKLLAMVKHLGIAQFAITKFKEAYPQYDMDAISKCTVEIGVIGPDGTAKQMPVSVAQIMAMVAPLESVKNNCNGCPANVSGRSFGCIGKVNYPITQESEEWLLSRLSDDAKSPSLALLLKYLSEVKADGAPVDANRTRSQMFALKAPSVRSWGGWMDKKTISSSQILHMLAFGGDMSPQVAQLYTKLLNLIAVQSERASQSDVIEQFKIYMKAIVAAGRLNAKLHIDA